MHTTCSTVSHELFSGMLLQHPDCLLVVAKNGEVLFNNHAAARLLCRLPDQNGHVPTTMIAQDEGNYRVHLKDISHHDLILDIHTQHILWQQHTAQFLTARDVTSQVKHVRELEQQVYRDPLTQLYNRRGLEHALGILNTLQQNTVQKINLLYIDINGLKQINDTLGHAQGDNVIREAAEIIKQVFSLTDIKARIGGDEFVVLVHEDRHTLKELISKLHDEIERRNHRPGRKFTLSMSIGSVQYSHNTTVALNDVIEQADQCMYEAKHRQTNKNLRHFNSIAIAAARTGNTISNAAALNRAAM